MEHLWSFELKTFPQSSPQKLKIENAFGHLFISSIFKTKIFYVIRTFENPKRPQNVFLFWYERTTDSSCLLQHVNNRRVLQKLKCHDAVNSIYINLHKCHNREETFRSIEWNELYVMLCFGPAAWRWPIKWHQNVKIVKGWTFWDILQKNSNLSQKFKNLILNFQKYFSKIQFKSLNF